MLEDVLLLLGKSACLGVKILGSKAAAFQPGQMRKNTPLGGVINSFPQKSVACFVFLQNGCCGLFIGADIDKEI